MSARKAAPATKAAKKPVKQAVKSKDAKPAEQITDLLPNARNPRKPWKSDKQRKDFLHSLQTFGDLSGIVFNRTTQQLVGGHKRVEEFKEQHSELKITEQLTTPDASGTVAYGQVILEDGTRFAYREVEWEKPKEAAANLAANKWGAEWDLAGVTDLMSEAKEGGFDLECTGFDLPEVTALLAGDYSGWNGEPVEEVGAAPGQTEYSQKDSDKTSKILSQVKDSGVVVNTGERWILGDHILHICSTVKPPFLWAAELATKSDDPKTIFVLCPDPVVALTDKPIKLFMIQPDKFVAGHIIANYRKTHAGKPCKLQAL